jgi:hypothetical protein
MRIDSGKELTKRAIPKIRFPSPHPGGIRTPDSGAQDVPGASLPKRNAGRPAACSKKA